MPDQWLPVEVTTDLEYLHHLHKIQLLNLQPMLDLDAPGAGSAQISY
jgi:hypothetical protein